MLVRGLWGRFVVIAALVAVLTAAAALAAPRVEAAPASPILEFVAPSFPVPFTAEGGAVTAVLANWDTVLHCDDSEGSGQITGPRSTVSHYVFTGCNTQGGEAGGAECHSAGAELEEIRSSEIKADLVYINQLTHQVGMLLAPDGGDYLTFDCGIEVNAIGPFLSPVGPIDQVAQTFTATLARVGSTQVPDQYEGPGGELLPAVPTGEVGTHPPAATGVELGFTVRTSVPIQIKALSSADIELARLNDELATLATKRHEEQEARDAAARTEADQRLREAIAAKKRQEERAREALQRGRKRAKRLRRCRKLIHPARRTRCEEKATKRYAGNPHAVASN